MLITEPAAALSIKLRLTRGKLLALTLIRAKEKIEGDRLDGKRYCTCTIHFLKEDLRMIPMHLSRDSYINAAQRRQSEDPNSSWPALLERLFEF
jgi:hypothetical protein